MIDLSEEGLRTLRSAFAGGYGASRVVVELLDALLELRQGNSAAFELLAVKRELRNHELCVGCTPAKHVKLLYGELEDASRTLFTVKRTLKEQLVTEQHAVVDLQKRVGELEDELAARKYGRP